MALAVCISQTAPSLAGHSGVWDLQLLWGEGRAMQLGSILGRCHITALAVYHSFSLVVPSTCLKCYHFVVCFTRASAVLSAGRDTGAVLHPSVCDKHGVLRLPRLCVLLFTLFASLSSWE